LSDFDDEEIIGELTRLKRLARIKRKKAKLIINQ